MLAQDFSKRLTIVVRKDLEGWQAANAIAHIAAYIGNKLEADFATGDFFVSADNVEFPRNSQYPIIIKGANSASLLKEGLKAIREQELLSIEFIREELDCMSDAEVGASLKAKIYADVELLGFGVFGENEQVKLLTKNFNLWK
jgi:hypothetical protein